ncbi:MAG: tetratricopeptide repeat protein [Caldilineaceae bacterium]
MLEIRLLGNPQILFNSQPVTTISWTKSQALLFYVALSKDPKSRLTLAGLLWPDKSDEDARTTLRQALRTITKALPDLLDSDNDSLGLNRSANVRIDVRDFEADAQRGLAGDLVALRRAADGYTGEFLSGFFVEDAAEFQDWVLVRREQLHTLALQVLHQLSVHCIQRREVGPGLLYTQRLLALEPWREETHQQLMRLLAWDGQFSAALAQYDRCEALLEKELDVPPAPETENLRHRIERIRRTRRSNLNPEPSTLIGRSEEVATLSQWLQRGERLVSIVAAGGMGKTRLALAVAHQLTRVFLEGVFWVDLADTTTTDALIARLCSALQLPLLSKLTPQQQLLDFLQDKELLLVLDNFEQLLEEAAPTETEASSLDLLQQLLERSPGLSLLVTSRIQLDLRHERIFQLAPLPFPSQIDHPANRDLPAVQLFAQVAQRVWHEFRLEAELRPVAEICQLLEGVPLAVELAAALVQTQPCATIAAALAQSFETLRVRWRDLPARQRSLRATFDYSFSLLPTAAQQLLSKLAVFHDGFTFVAAQAIAAATPDLLAVLSAHSLVHRNSEDRYTLHEMVRQFARSRLAEMANEEVTALQRHSHWFLAEMGQRYSALQEGDVEHGLHWYTGETGNWQAAWRWMAEAGDLRELNLALPAMSAYFLQCGPFERALQLLSPAIERLQRDVSFAQQQPALLIHLLLCHAELQCKLGHNEKLDNVLTQTITLAQQSGDPLWEAQACHIQSMVLAMQGNYDHAAVAAEKSAQLAQHADHQRQLAKAYHALGEINRRRGNHPAAALLFEQALHIFQAEEDRVNILDCQHQLGLTWMDSNQLPPARQIFQECLALAKQMGERTLETSSLLNLGIIHDFFGEYDRSRALFEEAQQLAEEIGSHEYIHAALTNAGLAAQLVGNFDKAREHYQRVLYALRATPGHYQEGLLLANLALLAHQTGDQLAAKQYSLETLRLAESSGSLFLKSYALTFLAHAEVELGALNDAWEHYLEAGKLRSEMGAENLRIESLAGCVRVLLAKKQSKRALPECEEILRYLQEYPEAEGTDEPLRIYLTLYQALRANYDSRADSLLATAQQILQTRVNRLSDPDVRQSFLTQIKTHQIIGMKRLEIS